ncbi:uncharacterized protein HMPREF1541_09199 [Cyphellophora europaea CBS 101466]|uniref:Uncharacterized protein n=1 Tax=Cyphellophora europaea (strain CBS 101466) TaxID=1220924 RepID=W2SBI9_CYPE1|nr:uncharacterized protein HMPREF1541_09199 [Cyphellophora europaea CBS 101466]ETN45368.1 hypothetical protein HMPREF1541_09199 [Cyphellophora europaea CBS 101466]
MYRKRNGSLGFSMTRLAHTVVPNFFGDDSPTLAAALTPHRRDMTYMHQLASANPHALDEHTFYVAGVTDNEASSRKVFRALRKHGVLRAEDDATVDTTHIGRGFVNQVACISVARQRELVNMLFWWEEECQRLTKLEAEEAELTGLIDAVVVGGEDDDTGRRQEQERLDQLKFARERVRMKRRQRPSQRMDEVENDEDDLLAAFQGPGRSRSAPEIRAGGLSEMPQREQERPPEYYA